MLSDGPKPPRPGLVASGMTRLAVPVAALTENFSPMSRMAPPPLGSDTDGGAGGPPPAGCHPLAGALAAAPDAPGPAGSEAGVPGDGVGDGKRRPGSCDGAAGSAGNTAQPSWWPGAA